MAQDESVTDEYLAGLRSGFLARAESVKAASDWPETQRRMNSGTYPYLVAIGRVNEGWSREEIQRELDIRLIVGNLPGSTFIPGE